MTARWERDAKTLVQSLMFKELTEREVQLWNYLRMTLEELNYERSRRPEQQVWGEDIYGDGY